MKLPRLRTGRGLRESTIAGTARREGYPLTVRDALPCFSLGCGVYLWGVRVSLRPISSRQYGLRWPGPIGPTATTLRPPPAKIRRKYQSERQFEGVEEI